MALLGVPFSDSSENPEFNINDLKFWIPTFKNYLETSDGQVMFDNLYPIANSKILYSVFGSDWKLAISLCIAHYATLIGKLEQAPNGDTLGEVAGSGVMNGVINSVSIGGFSKTFDLSHTMSDDKDAIWWNSTTWGMQLYNLFRSKPAPTIFVVTPTVINQRPNNRNFWPFR